MKIIFSPESALDIENIYYYFSYTLYDQETGEDIINEIENFVLTTLLDNPEIGRKRSDISYDFIMRSFVVSSYVLYYYCKENEIHIVRVLHQKQDINKNF